LNRQTRSLEEEAASHVNPNKQIIVAWRKRLCHLPLVNSSSIEESTFCGRCFSFFANKIRDVNIVPDLYAW
jgi:hypothetical protein